MADGNYLVSFGAGATLYTFPTTQAQLRDNFYDFVPRTVRLPGADGGFDQFGSQRAPKEIGNVSVTFSIDSDTRDGMDVKRDLIRQMANWGVQKLIKRFGSNGQRYCYARVNSVVMSENPGGTTDNFQTVTVDFQVADPYWYTDGNWGTGVTMTLNGVTTLTQAIVQAGNFPSYPKITVTKSSGANITTLRIARMSGATELDYIEIVPSPAISAGSSLVFDVTTYTASGYLANPYRYMSWGKASWFRFLPGSNDIKVTATGHTGLMTVKFETYARY